MMKIYKLTSPNTDLVYVGKTIMRLCDRMKVHRWTAKNTRDCSSHKIFDCGEASIELIEETEDREAFWINELNSCNNSRLNGGMTSAEKNKKYRDNNQDKVTEVFLKSDRNLRKDYHVEDFEMGNPNHVISTDGEEIEDTWATLRDLLEV